MKDAVSNGTYFFFNIEVLIKNILLSKYEGEWRSIIGTIIFKISGSAVLKKKYNLFSPKILNKIFMRFRKTLPLPLFLNFLFPNLFRIVFFCDFMLSKTSKNNNFGRVTLGH